MLERICAANAIPARCPARPAVPPKTGLQVAMPFASVRTVFDAGAGLRRALNRAARSTVGSLITCTDTFGTGVFNCCRNHLDPDRRRRGAAHLPAQDRAGKQILAVLT